MKNKIIAIIILSIVSISVCGCNKETEVKDPGIVSGTHTDSFVPLVKVSDDYYAREDIYNDYKNEYSDIEDKPVSDLILDSDLSNVEIPEYIPPEEVEADSISDSEYDAVYTLDEFDISNIEYFEYKDSLNNVLIGDLWAGNYIRKALEMLNKDFNIDVTKLEVVNTTLDDVYLSEYSLIKMQYEEKVIYMYVSEALEDIKIKIQ